MSIGSSVEQSKKMLIDDWQVSVTAMFFALCAVISGAKPTGVPLADITYVLLAVSAIVVISSRVHWWVISLYVAVSAVMAFSLVGIAVGLVLYLVTFLSASHGEASRWMKAVVIGISINLMFHSHLSSVFGLASFLGLASNGLLFYSGLKFAAISINATRKKMLVGLSVFATIFLGLFLALLLAKEPLRNGSHSVRAGIAAVNQGDLVVAREQLDAAQKQMETASRWLNSPLTFFAQAIPVVSQHRAAAAQLSASSSQSLQKLSIALSQFDLEKLRVVNGSLDLVAIQDLKEPLAQILEVMNDLRSELTAVQSPWLIGRIQDEFTELGDDLDEQLERGANAQLALDVAPKMLGRDNSVTYFIALTTPVESRGSGGFMGNWIELSVNAGQITVNKFGRSTDLNEAGSRPRSVTGPSDWLMRYGDFGFTNALGGNVGENPWQNITMSPHFPSTAQVISELYPQSGGTKLDGVFAMDVKTLSALLDFSGPVAIAGIDEPLTSANAVEFLLHDQYVKYAVDKRIDLLASVTRQALQQIMNGELPSPNIVANRLGPMVAEGRLTGYSPDEAIQDLFTRIGMSGSFACDKAADCFAVTVDNASGNKIDYFLHAKVDYSVAIESGSSEVVATAKISVTNSSPSKGLPDYVIGNMVGLPRGSNRMLLSIHSRLGLVQPLRSDDKVRWQLSTEQGHYVFSAYIDVPPGATRQITLDLGGDLNLSDGYSLEVFNPPAVHPWSLDIDLSRDGSKATLVNSDKPGTWIFP
jgi:hypothetical protein